MIYIITTFIIITKLFSQERASSLFPAQCSPHSSPLPHRPHLPWGQGFSTSSPQIAIIIMSVNDTMIMMTSHSLGQGLTSSSTTSIIIIVRNYFLATPPFSLSLLVQCTIYMSWHVTQQCWSGRRWLQLDLCHVFYPIGSQWCYARLVWWILYILLWWQWWRWWWWQWRWWRWQQWRWWWRLDHEEDSGRNILLIIDLDAPDYWHYFQAPRTFIPPLYISEHFSNQTAPCLHQKC